MTGTGPQSQYWTTFANLKRNAIYIDRYEASVEKTDRAISIAAAIMSSSAVAGWLIWKEHSTIWAIIIGASQLLAVIRPHLPYSTRLRALTALAQELNGLALDAEDGWYNVAHGNLTDPEIHQATMVLKRKCQQAIDRAFKGISLPDKNRLQKRSEIDANQYMSTMTGV